MTINMLNTTAWFSRFSLLLALQVFTSLGVYGYVKCPTQSAWQLNNFCDDTEYCCGPFDNDCCSIVNTDTYREPSVAMEVVGLLTLLIIFVCCPVMCYRCCCRRTTNQGFIYSPPPANTSVTVSMPPQTGQVPYPTVVPYPQQTPYPPQQYSTNPYYNMPPPAYSVATQAGTQQTMSPSAPYLPS